MYFLVILFIIVVFKLYIERFHKVKEKFFFRDLLDEQENKNEPEKSSEHQSLIEKIRLKFEELKEKQKNIAMIKEETKENQKQGTQSLNKNSYYRRLLNQ